MEARINHNQLKFLLEKCWKNKVAIFVFGKSGVGKSQTIKEWAINKAKELGKQFVDFVEIGSKYEEIKKEPEKYFVFADIRLLLYNPDDIKGLPVFSNSAVEWKLPKEIEIFTVNGVSGVMFLDELNLAPQFVQNIAYQITLDRKINGKKISDNVLIVSAGNLSTEKAYTYELPEPLKKRMLIVVLDVDVDGFVRYAKERNIDNRIIAYLLFRNEALWQESTSNESNAPSPRQWEMLSNLIKGENDLEIIKLLAIATIGAKFGIDFYNFCKEAVEVEKYIKEPKLLEKDYENKRIDKVYAVIGAIVDRINSGKLSLDYLKKIIELNIGKDIKLVALRMLAEKYHGKIVNMLSNELVDEFLRILRYV